VEEMKKLYLLFIAVFMSALAFGQTFSIITPPGGAPGLVTAPGIDVTGDTVIYCDDFSDSTIIIQGKLYVVNETGATISTVVRRFEDCTVSGSENYFCWDICWSTTVDVSGPMSIAPSDTATYFYGDYKPLGNIGASVIRYRFYDENNQTNFNEVYIKFNAGSCLAIEDCNVGIDEEEASLTSVYPNPATDQITLEYNTAGDNGTIIISDLTGKVVRTVSVSSSSTKSVIGLEGLHSGVYFYSFQVNNKPVSTRKFIIK
jgi:hypothetical protein